VTVSYNTWLCTPHIVNHPSIISTADVVNMKGHNLKGRNLILKPVNTDMTAKTIRQVDDDRYTDVEIMVLGSIAVTTVTREPIKIRATPSIIHSIAMMCRLSALISPNPRMIDFVGKRCDAPHKKGNAAPI
jgi:hypothetical protein